LNEPVDRSLRVAIVVPMLVRDLPSSLEWADAVDAEREDPLDEPLEGGGAVDPSDVVNGSSSSRIGVRLLFVIAARGEFRGR